MASTPRDIYVPAASWQTIADVVAPKPRGMDPAFERAMEHFQRYANTIQGEVGDAIRQCKDHLERFLKTARSIVEEEAGEDSARLGRPRDIRYGQETLVFQVFNYRGEDTVSVREDRFADLMTRYDLFLETMRFMDKKVEEGDLGILRNSFKFIHKPMEQSKEAMNAALDKTRLERTTEIGKPADPNYMHITGSEPAEGMDAKCVCRILKPGYAYDGREIQEGVVVVAS